MRDQPKDVQEKFEEFMAKKLAEAEENEQNAAEVSHNECDTAEVNDSEVADVSEHDATLVNENQMVSVEEELHSPCTNDAPSQKKLKRGERISFNGSPGNFLTYTPNKTHGNVILRGNNSKPLRIPLTEVKPAQKLAFDGQYFIVAGKLTLPKLYSLKHHSL